MVSVGNVDLVLAALRSRLQRVATERQSGPEKTHHSTGAARSPSQRRVKALDAIRELSPDEFGRSLVRAMLEIELGEAISDDPRFHRLADQTYRILIQDPDLEKAFRQIQRGET